MRTTNQKTNSGIVLNNRISARVLLADDHHLVRSGIRSLLESMPTVTVVAEATNGREVLELLETTDVNLVFMDISMPGLNGLEALSRIKEQFPHVSVVILSMHQIPDYALKAMQLGASGYLLKKDGMPQLRAAVQAVLSGQTYISDCMSKAFAKSVEPSTQMFNRTLDRLSARQREILQLLAEGETTKGIAQTLRISNKTVEYHRMKLMQCLGIFDVPGLVRFAVRAGLVGLDGE